jgi:RNA polymerase sigma-70 factor (sigma-E family)
VNPITFDEFVAAHGRGLLRTALMLCGDTHRAEDLAQATLAGAFRKWRRVAAAGEPAAYVRAMLVNEFLSWRRRRWTTELPVAETGDTALVDDHQQHYAARSAAWELLAGLPRRQRAVLVLRYYEDLSDADIGRVLGCSASTVRSQASRGLAALRAAVPTLDREALP